MTRHYSTRSLFRQLPSALLARRLLADLDFGTMKETKPGALFNAWLALPEDERKAMDTEI